MLKEHAGAMDCQVQSGRAARSERQGICFCDLQVREHFVVFEVPRDAIVQAWCGGTLMLKRPLNLYDHQSNYHPPNFEN